MARIRTIKPEFFRHHELYSAEIETGLPLRIAFAGLWTAADREGRFRWRPEELKLDCLPFDDCDFSRVLHALATRGFIAQYHVGLAAFGYIPTWRKHQVINNRERPSELPNPEENQQDADACPTRAPRDSETHVHAQGEGEGEGKGITPSPVGPLPRDSGDAPPDPPAAPAARPRTRGRRWRDGEHVPEAWLAWAIEAEGLTRAEAEREGARFSDHWVAQSGQRAVKRSWEATWRNWIRSPIRQQGNGTKPTREPPADTSVVARLEREIGIRK